ncbi:hypothetical protein PPACK8108_LOCUS15236 [Phakopsora pachyrhizi]|uniref:Uncharacterized protein n=1 Tax=Phakopsora pachyrhizi TaxID=170000 RepID=A0AAV0B7M2_PHAPC|nr:hypothetical protein PPACK8108_LOCUS15236 [Phakopsora pachyrhizi]
MKYMDPVVDDARYGRVLLEPNIRPRNVERVYQNSHLTNRFLGSSSQDKLGGLTTGGIQIICWSLLDLVTRILTTAGGRTGEFDSLSSVMVGVVEEFGDEQSHLMLSMEMEAMEEAQQLLCSSRRQS